MRPAVLALVLVVAPGCVTWPKWRQHREVDDAAREALVPGETTLESALAGLGAPLVVRENGDGAVLAWGWAEERQWSARVDVPISEVDVSFAYQDTDLGLEGLVLFFDAGWRLTHAREGALAEVLPPAQDRARLVED